MISREPYRLLLPSATVIGPLLATAWNAIQLGRRRIYPEAADSSGSLFDLMLTSLSNSISRLPFAHSYLHYLPWHLSPSSSYCLPSASLFHSIHSRVPATTFTLITFTLARHLFIVFSRDHDAFFYSRSTSRSSRDNEYYRRYILVFEYFFFHYIELGDIGRNRIIWCRDVPLFFQS